MILLADLRRQNGSNHKSWDLSEDFADLSVSVTLHQRSGAHIPLALNRQKGKGTEEIFESRSYSRDFAVEVFASSRCGIDLELPTPSDPEWSIESPLYQLAVLAKGEKELVLATEYRNDTDLASVIWSSKEALAKALGDASSYEPTDLYSPITWGVNGPANWKAKHIDYMTEDDERLVIWVIVEKVNLQIKPGGK